MEKIPVALQLFTVREDCEKDFEGTVRKVAEIGYQGVELAGDGGLTPWEMKVLLEECGLQVAGSHAGLDDLQNNLNKVTEFNSIIRNTRIVCPFLPQEFQDRGEAGYHDAAGILNGIGEELRVRGFSFSYHNHSFEFKKSGEQYLLDILLASTDARDVKWEMDTYWVRHGGADPVEYLRKYSGRIELLHIKDMADDEARSFAEIGSGILDWDAIFETAQEAGVAWYIVEQDVCAGPPLESAAKSLEYLRSRGLVD